LLDRVLRGLAEVPQSLIDCASALTHSVGRRTAQPRSCGRWAGTARQARRAWTATCCSTRGRRRPRTRAHTSARKPQTGPREHDLPLDLPLSSILIYQRSAGDR